MCGGTESKLFRGLKPGWNDESFSKSSKGDTLKANRIVNVLENFNSNGKSKGKFEDEIREG